MPGAKRSRPALAPPPCTPGSYDHTYIQFFSLVPSVSIDCMRIVGRVRSGVDHPRCTCWVVFGRCPCDSTPFRCQYRSQIGPDAPAVPVPAFGTYSARPGDGHCLCLYHCHMTLAPRSSISPSPPILQMWSPTLATSSRSRRSSGLAPGSRFCLAHGSWPHGPWANGVTLLATARCFRRPLDDSAAGALQ
jgi:uncharacterized protein (DUF2237 family)